jgi:hypothetical protein
MSGSRPVVQSDEDSRGAWEKRQVNGRWAEFGSGGTRRGRFDEKRQTGRRRGQARVGKGHARGAVNGAESSGRTESCANLLLLPLAQMVHSGPGFGGGPAVTAVRDPGETNLARPRSCHVQFHARSRRYLSATVFVRNGYVCIYQQPCASETEFSLRTSSRKMYLCE